MKKKYKNIYSFNTKILKKTVKTLKRGEILGLPTETVYGLGGNAYLRKAILKIFKLKKRPPENPLIIHYYNKKYLKNDVIINENFNKLYKKFCPGPITFILKKNKNSKIISLANANQNTVAIRFPSQKIIRTILKNLDFPLAMPSANISSRLSPISAFDVFDEFKKKISIINGGKSRIGIESTVIDLTNKPRILRPGIIGADAIKKLLKINLSKKKTQIKSPGLLKKHYSPGIPVIIGRKPKSLKHAYIIFGKSNDKRKNYFNLSKKANLKEAAANLYMTMRKIKKKGYEKIFVIKFPNYGPGVALNDRILKASK